jgi:predicted  nucleic acid-binding Zn-ribbon protein
MVYASELGRGLIRGRFFVTLPDSNNTHEGMAMGTLPIILRGGALLALAVACLAVYADQPSQDPQPRTVELQLNDCKTDLQAAQAAMQQLRKERDDARNLAQAAQRANSDLAVQLRALRGQVAAATAASRRTDPQQTAAPPGEAAGSDPNAARITRQAKLIDAMNRERHALREQLRQASQRSQAYRNRMQALQQELQAGRAEIAGLQTDGKSAADERDRLAEQLRQSRKLAADLTARLDGAETELQALQSRVGTLNQYVGEGQRQIEQLSSENSRAQLALQQVRGDAQAIASQLLTENDKCQTLMGSTPPGAEPDAEATTPQCCADAELCAAELERQGVDLSRRLRSTEAYAVALQQRLYLLQGRCSGMQRQCTAGLSQCRELAAYLAALQHPGGQPGIAPMAYPGAYFGPPAPARSARSMPGR